jgi:predicted nuclease of predicted toxin-antitoxin system
MKLLLDENLPTKIIREFDLNQDIHTVKSMFWRGKKNGELMQLLVSHNFEGLVTLDKNLIFQQNLPKFPIKIFILRSKSSKIPDLITLIHKLNNILKNLPNQQIIEIKP